MSRVVCGSNTGLIKVVDVQGKSIQSSYGIQSADESISALAISADHETIIAARRSGRVTFTSIKNNTEIGDICFKSKNLVGLSTLANNQVLVSDALGQASIASSESKSVIKCWKIAENVRGFYCNRSRLYCGGQEQDLRIWDIDTQTITFRAKNVPLDKLSLRKPICINAIAANNADENLVATGTAYHQIRLYDTRRGRRPVLDVDIGDNPITSLCIAAVSNQTHNLFAGDGVGVLQQFDLRKNLAVVGRYRGHTGSIRAIALHQSGLMASVGLDRMLHIHDVQTRVESSRIYMKQALDAVCWMKESEIELQTNDRSGDVVDDDDDDGLWNDMESVDDEDDQGDDDNDQDDDFNNNGGDNDAVDNLEIRRPKKRSRIPLSNHDNDCDNELQRTSE